MARRSDWYIIVHGLSKETTFVRFFYLSINQLNKNTLIINLHYSVQ